MEFFIIGIVALLLVIFLLCLDDNGSATLLLITIISLIILLIVVGIYTYTPVNRVMTLYEEGKVVKKYTIIEKDTTYKWVLKDTQDK